MVVPRLSVCALVICLCQCAAPSPDSAELEAFIAEYREAEGVPGVLVGVGSPNGAHRFYTSGVTKLQGGRVFRPDDVFFIGSATKIFTAVVVLQLVDEGNLTLEDRLADIVPELTRSDEITLRQLLNHTSGLVDFYAYLYYRPKEEMIREITREWTQEEMLELAARFEPHFLPGPDWSYSSTNYFLLGLVIERVTGQSYAEAVRERILAPLGMKDTWLSGYEPPRKPFEAIGYLGPLDFWPSSEMFGEIGATSEIDGGNLEYAAGGMVSTASESLVFLRALADGRLLPDKMRAEMRRFVPAAALGDPELDASDMAYGLGWISMTRPEFSMEGHGGIYNGWTAGLWHATECDLVLVVFANRGFARARKLYDAIVPGLCGREAFSSPNPGLA